MRGVQLPETRKAETGVSQVRAVRLPQPQTATLLLRKHQVSLQANIQLLTR